MVRVVPILLLLVLATRPLCAHGPRPAAPAALPREIAGHGTTLDKAKDVALSNAVDALAGYLQHRDPSLFRAGWDDEATQTRLLHYLHAYLLEEPGRQGDDVVVAPELPHYKSWILPLRHGGEGNDILSAEQNLERQRRAGERQAQAAGGLFAISAVLGAVALLVRVGRRLPRPGLAWLPHAHPSWLMRAAVIGVTVCLLAFVAYFLTMAVGDVRVGRFGM